MANIHTLDSSSSMMSNRVFNFTNHIKEDMSTFLATYTASFKTVGEQEYIQKLSTYIEIENVE